MKCEDRVSGISETEAVRQMVGYPVESCILCMYHLLRFNYCFSAAFCVLLLQYAAVE